MESIINMSIKDSNLTTGGEVQLQRLNSEQFLYLLPAIVYTSLLMMIGTPGNVVVFYVYFFKWRKSTSRMFILFLTGLDLVNCVTTLPMEIFIMRFSIMLDIPWMCKISRFSTFTMNSASACILVAIAVDRFKRICRPHGSQFTSATSKYICIACLGFALLLTWPAVILYGTRIIKLGHVEGCACLIENKFDTTEYPYIFFIVHMVSTLTIFLTLSVLYYFVGLAIYRHRKQRMQRQKNMLAVKSEQHDTCPNSNVDTLLQPSNSSDLQDKTQLNDVGRGKENGAIECKDMTVRVDENNAGSTLLDVSAKDDHSAIESKRPSKKSNDGRTSRSQSIKNSLKKINDNANCIKVRIGRSTLMLFLITLAYIISFMPFFVIAIIRQTYPGFKSQLSEASLMAYYIFLRSYLLSSAINPIIYSFCNAQFRTFCFDLFRRKSRRHGV